MKLDNITWYAKMSVMAKQLTENKMGFMPENRLLLSMALPIMASMVVQALYNVVDSMFVSQLSENALTAVSLAFPVQNLIIAASVGTGVGVNALLSKSLGEKRFDVANKTAVNSLFLALVSATAFMLFGLLFSRTFFSIQTNIPDIVEDGTDYLFICCICSFGPFLQIALEKLLQSTGKTFYSMVSQMAGAVTNIILDPILIFGYLGFPAMGVAGAAVATVLGQFVGAGLALYFNIRKNPDIRLRLRGFRPDKKIVGGILKVGVPSILMGSLGSVMTFGLNKIVIAFTPTASAVVGVYFKLQSFVFMPVFGLNNGLVPIVAYNYGARNPKRIKNTIRYGVIYAVGIMLIGTAAFWLFTPELLGIFNASPDMLAIGVPALRTISLSYGFAGFAIVVLSVCQALGRGFLSLTVSAVRQLMVLLPCVYILSRLFGLSAVWWAFPISEMFALTLCTIFLRRLFKTVIQPLDGTAVT